MTAAGVADAQAKGVKPNGGAGFAYLRGPDDALVEYQGNMPAERFNHVHMYQDQPFCAALWYQKHLNVPARAPAAGAASAQAAARQAVRSGTAPSTAAPNARCPRSTGTACTGRRRLQTTVFGDVALFFYMNQGRTPAAPTRGHLMDHFAVSVADLDAWIAKLKAEKVTFLEELYVLSAPQRLVAGRARS